MHESAAVQFPEWYKEIESLGDPLTGISDRIDFERISPFLLIFSAATQTRVEDPTMIPFSWSEFCYCNRCHEKKFLWSRFHALIEERRRRRSLYHLA